jgi:tRNA(Ile)-lysidine synthase
MPDALLARVRQFLDAHAVLPDGARLVVGVSGGADSMVCLDVLHRLGYAVVAAHVHYGLRPAADDEAATVQSWCDAHDIPVRFRRCDPAARADAHDTSVQAAARTQRYRFFAEVAAATDAPAVAVGHHRDDQAETVLLHLMRGSGPEGLAGMPPVRALESESDVHLLRPLLDERRATINAYAASRGLPWHVDASNRDPSYRRGCVRTTVLPALNACAEGTPETLARTADLLRGYVDASLRPALRKRFARCHAPRPSGGWLDLYRLRQQPAVWRGRLLLEAVRRDLPSVAPHHAMIRELDALLDAQVGRRVDLGGATVWRERGGLRLVPAPAAPGTPEPVMLPQDTTVALPNGGAIRAEKVPSRPPTLDPGTPHIAYAAANRLAFPLVVRPWRDGERFRPLGLDGTKRVSDLLTDARVAPHRRQQVPVVLSDDQIVWVVGIRLAHGVRVREATQDVVRLTFRPGKKPSSGSHFS